jgi:glucokinase
MVKCSDVVVAMDWGGTWIRAAVIDRQGGILWQCRVPNIIGGKRAQLLNAAQALVRVAIDKCDGRPLAGLGIAIAGPVDIETGTLYEPPNLPGLDGVSLKNLWEPMFGHRIWVGNDANLAALGEYRYGAGRDAIQSGQAVRTLVYITVSTGIGAGVVSQDQMFLGAHGLAAEIGHMVIDRSARGAECRCGNNGCLESLASGTAISRIAGVRLNEPDSVISSLSLEQTNMVTSETVFRAASQGDAFAKSILTDIAAGLSVGLTNILHIFNPDLIVLGGGVTIGLNQLGMLPEIHSASAQNAMSRRHREFRLVASGLGDAVGMLGAAGFVWKQLESDMRS